jgi:hypothetical protein
LQTHDGALKPQTRTGQLLKTASAGSASITVLGDPGPASAGSESSPMILAGFPIMSRARQVAVLGADQGVALPDTQLAAGPNSLLELVNASGSVWTKSGKLLGMFDLNSFFPVPAGYTIGNPRVAYDRQSGRWLATAVASDGQYDSIAYLASSLTDDPLGSWHAYTVASNQSGIFYDQPKLGISDDKVVLSWNDFDQAATTFLGEEIWILDKSNVLQGIAATVGVIGPDPNRFGIAPAWSLSATSDEYLLYNNADPALGQNSGQPTLGVVRISGTPSQGNLSWHEWDLPMPATNVPPAAIQPGTAPTIATDDDRLQNAVWQDGVLWTAANDACQPPGGSTLRACLRLVQVDTHSSTPQLLQSFDASVPDADLFYPVVTLDALGNAFVAYNESSASAFPSVRATTQLATAPAGTLTASVLVAQSAGAYNACATGCDTAQAPASHWGHYSGAAPDPSDPTRIWLAGEDVPSPTNPTTWGTSAGELTLATGPLSPVATTTPGGMRVFIPLLINRSSGMGW